MESTIEAGRGREREGLNNRLRGQRGASRGRLAFSGSAGPPAINCPLYRNVGGPRSAYPPLLPPAPGLPLSAPASSNSDGNDTRRPGRFSFEASPPGSCLIPGRVCERMSADMLSASFPFVSLVLGVFGRNLFARPSFSRFVARADSGPSLAANTYGGIDLMEWWSGRAVHRVYIVFQRARSRDTRIDLRQW